MTIKKNKNLFIDQVTLYSEYDLIFLAFSLFHTSFLTWAQTLPHRLQKNTFN